MLSIYELHLYSGEKYYFLTDSQQAFKMWFSTNKNLYANKLTEKVRNIKMTVLHYMI